jgi:putative transposase
VAIPQGPNQRWSLGFVADALSWEQRFRVLAVVDDFTREALTTKTETTVESIQGADPGSS